MTNVLPPIVEPCECTGSIFAIESESDGISTVYECEECGELLADLICGAEP